MDFELGIADRVTLLGVLSADVVEANFLTLKELRLVREELSFAEAEAVEIGLETLPEGRVKWRNDKECCKTIPIGPQVLKVVQTRLRQLDAAGKLRDQHMSVYEKFASTPEAVAH